MEGLSCQYYDAISLTNISLKLLSPSAMRSLIPSPTLSMQALSHDLLGHTHRLEAFEWMSLLGLGLGLGLAFLSIQKA